MCEKPSTGTKMNYCLLCVVVNVVILSVCVRYCCAVLRMSMYSAVSVNTCVRMYASIQLCYVYVGN